MATRTTRQKEADELDLTVFRCMNALFRFADDHKDKDVRKMGMEIGMMRHRVRRHMHTADISDTAETA